MPVGFIEEQGCRMLLLDFSGLKESLAALAEIGAARQFFEKLPQRKEILTLVDVSRMRYDNVVLKAFQEGAEPPGLVYDEADNLFTHADTFGENIAGSDWRAAFPHLTARARREARPVAV